MAHYSSPILSNRQRQIILGTILGGSSITKPSKGKHYYLSMRDKNGKWVEYKSLELKCLAGDKPFTIEKTNRWHSLCFPIMDEFREMFYKNGKRCLQKDVIHSLSDIAFSIWYGDCARHKGKNIIMNTNIWGEKGTKLLCQYFNEIDMTCKIIKDHKLIRIQFDEKGSEHFWKIAEPNLPLWFLKERFSSVPTSVASANVDMGKGIVSS